MASKTQALAEGSVFFLVCERGMPCLLDPFSAILHHNEETPESSVSRASENAEG